MRRGEWRDWAKPGYRARRVYDRDVVVHSYKRATGESVELVLSEFAFFVAYVDGHVIHSEARARHQGAHTEETARARALAYEQQDRAEYLRLTKSQPQPGDSK